MSITSFIKSVFTKSSENDGMPQLKTRGNQNDYENSGLNKNLKNQHNNSNNGSDTSNTSNNSENNNNYHTSTSNDKTMFNLTSEQWCRITDEFPQFSETKELMDFDAKDNQETTPATPVFDPNSFDLFDSTLDLTENSKLVTADAQKSVNLNTETGEGSALLAKSFNFDHQLLASISRTDALRWKVLPIELSGSTLTVLCSIDTHKGLINQHFANVYPEHNVVFQIIAWKTLQGYITYHYDVNGTGLIVSEETRLLEQQKSLITQIEANVEMPLGIRFERGSRVEESNVFKTMLGSWLRETQARRGTDCDIDLDYDHHDNTKLIVKARVDRQQTPIFEHPMSLPTYVKLCTVIKSSLGIDTSSYHDCSGSRTRAELVYANRVTGVELRTNMLPSGRGIGASTYSIRFQCREQFIPTLHNIGLFPDQIEILEIAVMLPGGLILITGGINSGKNTTLHALLKLIVEKMPNKKIVSIEDPIEANLSGITQIQINPDQKATDKESRGYSYYTAYAMRHNINVLSVGETRDEKSASFVLEGSKTGQLMISTYHSGTATEAIERFTAMVGDATPLASALQIIVNQRLIRMNCKHCEKVVDRNLPNIPRLDAYIEKAGLHGKMQFMRSSGKLKDGSFCKTCNGTGLHGLIGVFEILTFADKIRDMILKKSPEFKIRKKTIKKFGFKTIWINGLRRVATGDICLTELINECGYPNPQREGLADVNQIDVDSVN